MLRFLGTALGLVGDDDVVEAGADGGCDIRTPAPAGEPPAAEPDDEPSLPSATNKKKKKTKAKTKALSAPAPVPAPTAADAAEAEAEVDADSIPEDEDEDEGEGDDGFLQVFASRRGAASSKKKKAAPSAAGPSSAGSSAGLPPPQDAGEVRLRPPERLINREVRKHDRAVATLVRRSATARSMALDALEAMEQSHSSGSTSAPAAAAAPPPPPVPQPMSIEQAFARAAALERASASASPASSPAAEAALLRAWALCFGVAERALARAPPGPPVSAAADAAARAMMQALQRQATLLEHAGRFRAAIAALDRAAELRRSAVPDTALLRGVSGMLQQAGRLCVRVGSIEAMLKRVAKAKVIDDFLDEIEGEEGAGEVGAEAGSQSVPDAEPDGEHEEVVEAAPEAAHAASQTPPRLAAEAEAPVPAPAPTPQARPAPVAFVMPADDGSAMSLFMRAVAAAMFGECSFDLVTALLNSAMLGNARAAEAIGLAVPGANVTLLMVAAGADRADLVRRLLAAASQREHAQRIVCEVDSAGTNAIAHACSLGRSGALDALLRALHASRPVYTPYLPPGAAEPETASLGDVGISLAQAQSYAQPLQAQLRLFITSPATYVESAGAELLRTQLRKEQLRLQPQALHFAAPQPLFGGLAGDFAGAAFPLLPAQVAALQAQAQAQAQAYMANMTLMMTRLASAREVATAAPPQVSIARLSAPTQNFSRAAGEGKLVGRPLAQWADAGASSGTLLEESSGGRGGVGRPSFDQFKVNSERFGVRDTYDEALYTTPLDLATFSADELAAAELLASEIAAAEACDGHLRRMEGGGADDADEDALFSAVSRKVGRGGGRGSGSGGAFTDAGVSARSRAKRN